MNIKSRNFIIVAIITFVILFLMNYIGNPEDDVVRLSDVAHTARSCKYDSY